MREGGLRVSSLLIFPLKLWPPDMRHSERTPFDVSHRLHPMIFFNNFTLYLLKQCKRLGNCLWASTSKSWARVHICTIFFKHQKITRLIHKLSTLLLYHANSDVEWFPILDRTIEKLVNTATGLESTPSQLFRHANSGTNAIPTIYTNPFLISCERGTNIHRCFAWISERQQ